MKGITFLMSESLSKDYWSKSNKWFIDAYNSTFIESIKHAPVRLREDLAVMSTKLIDAKKILDLGCGPYVQMFAIRS